jgi:hypothetical protein
MALNHFEKLDLDPDPHQGEKQNPDPHQSEKLEFILDHWRVQTWEKASGRIRIRINLKCKSRIRIRIKCEKQDPDPDSRQSDADLQHCL